MAITPLKTYLQTGLVGLGLVGLSLVSQALALAETIPYTAASGTATFDYRVVFPIKGKIAGVSSTVTLDKADLAATTGTVTVPVVNLKTGNSLRDTHAKGEEALNTAKFPNVTFSLAKVPEGKLVEGQTLTLTATGNLTVKGVSKTISAPIKATLNGDKVNISTQFSFNPHDFGVNYPAGSDSVTVGVNFSLSPK